MCVALQGTEIGQDRGSIGNVRENALEGHTERINMCCKLCAKCARIDKKDYRGMGKS